MTIHSPPFSHINNPIVRVDWKWLESTTCNWSQLDIWDKHCWYSFKIIDWINLLEGLSQLIIYECQATSNKIDSIHSNASIYWFFCSILKCYTQPRWRVTSIKFFYFRFSPNSNFYLVKRIILYEVSPILKKRLFWLVFQRIVE